jgi:hypothetical protein
VADTDDDARRRSAERADGESARMLVADYHQTQLRALLEHVRDSFLQLDAGTIDEFELDTIVHRYKRSANKLWFCGSGGGHWKQAARALAYQREHGTEKDCGKWQRRAEAAPRADARPDTAGPICRDA